MEGIDVGHSLSPSLNREQSLLLKSGDRFRYHAAAASEVVSDLVLAREAVVMVPGVLEELGVDELLAELEGRVVEGNIRYLREPTRGDGIEPHELDVLRDAFEVIVVADAFHTQRVEDVWRM